MLLCLLRWDIGCRSATMQTGPRTSLKKPAGDAHCRCCGLCPSSVVRKAGELAQNAPTRKVDCCRDITSLL